MLVFLSVVFLIYGAMHFYALRKVWLVLAHPAWLNAALALFGLVMTISPLILWYITRHGWHGAAVSTSWIIYTWMGLLFLFCCIALMFDLGHEVSILLGIRWPLGNLAVLWSAGLLALFAMGYGFFEARQIRVEKVEITTPKLASGQVTIAQLSDLHLGIMLGEDFLERILPIVKEARPDIVMATGDIVDGQGDDLDALAKRLHALQPLGGAFAVLGNHETYAGLESSIAFLKNAGFTVLRGEAAVAAGIVIAGVDDPSTGAGQDAKPATEQVLATLPMDRFVVLLKHQPVIDSDAIFDLQLSGHIHGGQVSPFGIFTRLAYGVRPGLTRLDGRWVYVSRGAGTWGPPMRVLAPPEITLITIRSANG